jgi:hypothetical protein
MLSMKRETLHSFRCNDTQENGDVYSKNIHS